MEEHGDIRKESSLFDALTSWPVFWQYAKGKIRHPGVRKHTQNISWMFFAKIASMAVSFFATAYIARHLGPTNYGELSYALSFTALFGFLASLGIEQIIYRNLIQYPEKREVYMGSALALRLVSSVVTIFICVITAAILSPKDVSLFLIFIVSLSFFFSSFQLFGYEFQAEAKAKFPSLLSFGVVLTMNILKIAVIAFHKGIIFLAALVILEPILYAIGYSYLRMKHYGSLKRLSFDKAVAFSMLKDAAPLIFASAFFAIYNDIDQVMIKNMMDATSVGLYGSAVAISEAWYFVPNMIINALFPAVLNAKKSSDALYHARIRKLFGVLFLVSCLIALSTTFLSKTIISIIFGGGFLAAFSVLEIYVWSNIGAALNLFAQQLLVAENLTLITLGTSFCGMATNVLLNIFLIPRYGMAGAAFASLVSYLVPFLTLFLFKKSRTIALNILRKDD